MGEFEMRIVNCTIDVLLGMLGLFYLVTGFYCIEIMWKGLVKWCANRIIANRKAKTVCK